MSQAIPKPLHTTIRPSIRHYRTNPISHRNISHSQPTHSQHNTSNFLSTFIQTHPPPQSSIAHFTAIPWTHSIVTNNLYEPIPFFSRHLATQTGENNFFAQTVNTPTTIPHLLALRHKDMHTPSTIPATPASPATFSTEDFEVLTLMSLASGLEAHPGIVHGGFQCVIFDEIMRFLILLHWDNTPDLPEGPRTRHYTVSMDTKYLGRVVAPSEVLVRARLVGRERRKWVARAEIVNEKGEVCTAAESIWVSAKPAGDAVK